MEIENENTKYYRPTQTSGGGERQQKRSTGRYLSV